MLADYGEPPVEIALSFTVHSGFARIVSEISESSEIIAEYC